VKSEEKEIRMMKARRANNRTQQQRKCELYQNSMEIADEVEARRSEIQNRKRNGPTAPHRHIAGTETTSGATRYRVVIKQLISRVNKC
jgi:hypothetical protein